MSCISQRILFFIIPIVSNNVKPVLRKMYHKPHVQNQKVNEIVDQGIIEPSISLWPSDSGVHTENVTINKRKRKIPSALDNSCITMTPYKLTAGDILKASKDHKIFLGPITGRTPENYTIVKKD